MFNQKPHEQNAAKSLTGPTQEWERDLVQAINATNQNIAILRAQTNNAQPTFSDIITPGQNQFYEKYSGVGITRPLPKHVEDDLTMRISSTIKRSVERMIQEKLNVLQGHLNQVNNQINSAEQCETRNRKILSSILRNIPSIEQNLKIISSEVDQLKDTVDQLQSDTTANKVWRDLTDSNMKNMKQHSIDMSKKFTDKSDVRQALELIASNVGTTVQSVVMAVKSDVYKDLQLVRSELMSVQKETRHLNESVSLLEARDPAIGREVMSTLVETVLVNELSTMENRIRQSCEASFVARNEEIKRMMDHFFNETITEKINEILLDDNDSEPNNERQVRLITQNFNQPDENEKVMCEIKGSIKATVVDMMETIVAEKMENKMLPIIIEELNSQRWKQSISDYVLTSIDVKVKELAATIERSVDVQIKDIVIEVQGNRDHRVHEFEANLTMLHSEISKNQEQALALITESAYKHNSDINELKKMFVNDLFAVKSKMKAMQSIFETLDASLEVVKDLDSKVERLESANKVLNEKLATIQELCSTSITGIQEKVDSLKPDLEELIRIRSKALTEELLHTSLYRSQNNTEVDFDSISAALTAVQRQCNTLDRRLRRMTAYPVKSLDIPVDDNKVGKTICKENTRIVEETTPLVKRGLQESTIHKERAKHLFKSLEISVNEDQVEKNLCNDSASLSEENTTSVLRGSPLVIGGLQESTKLKEMIEQPVKSYEIPVRMEEETIPFGIHTLQESMDEEQSLSLYVNDPSVPVPSENFSIHSEIDTDDEDVFDREVVDGKLSLTWTHPERPLTLWLQGATTKTKDDKSVASPSNEDSSGIKYDASKTQSATPSETIHIITEDTFTLPRFSSEDFQGSIEKYDYLERVPPIHERMNIENCYDKSNNGCNNTTEESVVTDDFESESPESSFESESLQSLLK